MNKKTSFIKPINADSSGNVIGYMDMTDFECELGAASGGNVVYASEEDCARNNSGCIDECGIVEVSVHFRRVMRQPKKS